MAQTRTHRIFATQSPIVWPSGINWTKAIRFDLYGKGGAGNNAGTTGSAGGGGGGGFVRTSQTITSVYAHLMSCTINSTSTKLTYDGTDLIAAIAGAVGDVTFGGAGGGYSEPVWSASTKKTGGNGGGNGSGACGAGGGEGASLTANGNNGGDRGATPGAGGTGTDGADGGSGGTDSVNPGNGQNYGGGGGSGTDVKPTPGTGGAGLIEITFTVKNPASRPAFNRGRGSTRPAGIRGGRQIV